MRNKIVILLAGAAMLGSAGMAAAQPGPGGPRGAGAAVTRDQALARADERFARMDANRDGRVTVDEARAARQAQRAERQGRLFERLDANRDGMISREEFSQRRAFAGGRGMRRPGMRGGMGAGAGAGVAARLFGSDGVLTREEARAAAARRFDMLDANRDGIVTREERRAARQQLRQRLREGRIQER